MTINITKHDKQNLHDITTNQKKIADTQYPSQAHILAQFKETRNRTLDLVKTLEKDDFVVQTAYYTSPPKWHVGHVSWLYEVILQKITSDYQCISKEFSKYLNSYYNQFGEPWDKGKRGVVSRPTLDQIFEYFNMVNQRVVNLLQTPGALDDDASNTAKHLFIMGLNHECQHQELLVYDLQHLLAEQYKPIQKNQAPQLLQSHINTTVKDYDGNSDGEMISISGGIYKMGYSQKEFCYDIELPEHKVYLNDYKIGKYPVTNKEYQKFINDKGYQNYKYWLSDGWEAVKKQGWEAPMYWEKNGKDWYTRDFEGKRKINPNEPVIHLSYYEADAYCRWAKKRLPTEAEWEKAASWNEQKQIKTKYPWGQQLPTKNHCNLLESYIWKSSEVGSYPQGKSYYGCHQMIGDVWEWTSSEFMGYPGFESGFDEYNDKWFTNQKVLRGGSFGTPSMSIRNSYRNFFRLDERWLFSGFRCAQDASAVQH